MKSHLYSILQRGMILLAVCLSVHAYPQSQYKKGYPNRSKDFDVLPGFQQPPKGYGNVPFYWWSGDTLTRERLAAQLDILSESATDGFAVSYIHTDPTAVPHAEEVVFSIEVQKGRQGTGAIAEPVKISTEEGRIDRGYLGTC